MSKNTDYLTPELQKKIQSFESTLNELQKTEHGIIINQILEECNIKENFEHKNKKQKLNSAAFDSKSKTTLFQLKNCSVISPLRKKLNFSISFDLHNKYNNIVLSNNDDEVQFQIENTKKNVLFAVFLPVLERQNLNYLLLKYDEEKEPLIVTLNKEDTVKQLESMNKITTEEGETLAAKFQSCVDYIRKQAILTGFKIADPFSTKHELNASFCLNAHIKSKEGTLYFLQDHLLFGIKKPIILLPISTIKSINYSTITRLTFSLTVILEEESEIEFSMIDQQEYDRINSFIVSKNVNDKSMSAELKAKATSKQEALGELSAAIKEAEDNEREVEAENEREVEEERDESDDDESDADYEADIDNIDGSEDSSDEDEYVKEQQNVTEEQDVKEEEDVKEEQEDIEKEDLEQEDIEHENIEQENIEEEDDEDEDSGVDYD